LGREKTRPGHVAGTAVNDKGLGRSHEGLDPVREIGKTTTAKRDPSTWPWVETAIGPQAQADARFTAKGEVTMLKWIGGVAVLLVALWAFGVALHLFGWLVHLLLGLAAISVLVRFLLRRRSA
jgi:hypothetical protein